MTAQDTAQAMWGLSEKQVSDGKMAYLALGKILSKEIATIRYAKRSFNSYGEYMFVTITSPVPEYEDGNWELRAIFWGLGWHSYRNRTINHWEFDVSYERVRENETEIDYLEAMDIIGAHHVKFKLTYGNPQPSEREQKEGRLFAFMASLSDEDAAITMSEDMDPDEYDNLLDAF